MNTTVLRSLPCVWPTFTPNPPALCVFICPVYQPDRRLWDPYQCCPWHLSRYGVVSFRQVYESSCHTFLFLQFLFHKLLQGKHPISTIVPRPFLNHCCSSPISSFAIAPILTSRILSNYIHIIFSWVMHVSLCFPYSTATFPSPLGSFPVSCRLSTIFSHHFILSLSQQPQSPDQIW